MEDEHIDDYISGIVQSCQFYLLEGNIHAALAHIISNLSALEETSDHPLKHQIVQQAQAGQLETIEQVERFLRHYL
jgi:cation transport ATPase|tara:strand:+ start:550 stop:777 length:228 start_codon:yes stop_codon:yes gene_type:complete